MLFLKIIQSWVLHGIAKMFVYCQHDWFNELLRPSKLCLKRVFRVDRSGVTD